MPVDVTADNEVFAPKGGVVLSPFEGVGMDIFANYGEGFRPVAANGDELPFNPGLDKAKLESWEVGVQYNSPDDVWHFRASRYETDLTNETAGNGQGNPPTQLGASRRIGYDVEGRVDITLPNDIPLSLWANYSHQDAKLLRLTGGVRYDYLDYDVEGLAVKGTTPMDVTADNEVFSPAAGVILSPFKDVGIDVFANYGEGFRPVAANGENRFTCGSWG